MNAARTSPLVHARGVRLEHRAGAATLVSPGGGSAHLVNATALAIWELCDGETTLEEMVAAVVDLFDADEGQVASDVAHALAELADLGLLVPAPRRAAAVSRSGQHTGLGHRTVPSRSARGGSHDRT